MAGIQPCTLLPPTERSRNLTSGGEELRTRPGRVRLSYRYVGILFLSNPEMRGILSVSSFPNKQTVFSPDLFCGTDQKEGNEELHRTCVSAGSLNSAVGSHLEFGHKAGELLMPVVESGRRRDDQKGTPDVVSLCRERTENTSAGRKSQRKTALPDRDTSTPEMFPFPPEFHCGILTTESIHTRTPEGVTEGRRCSQKLHRTRFTCWTMDSSKV